MRWSHDAEWSVHRMSGSLLILRSQSSPATAAADMRSYGKRSAEEVQVPDRWHLRENAKKYRWRWDSSHANSRSGNWRVGDASDHHRGRRRSWLLRRADDPSRGMRDNNLGKRGQICF